MKPVGIIGTAALFLLLGTTVPAWAQHGKQDEEQAKSDKQDKGKGHSKAGKQHGNEPQAEPQAKHEQKQQDQNRGQQQAREEQRGRQQHAQDQQRGEQERAARQHRSDQQQELKDRRQASEMHRAQQRLDNRPPGWDKGKKVGWNGGTVPPGHQARLPRERQRELITEQQARRLEYRRTLDQQRARQQEWAAKLQQEKRMTYYRYQQNYWSRMRQQQLALQRNYNYNNDPYFYTAPSYTYNYGGNNYQTNQYGANMLRSAINNGYSEGFRAGQADRQDRFGGGYQNSYAYQDANLGYNGNYVSQGDYNYYFREGFNRGYQDGYNSQTQYGQYSNGNRSILGTVLGAILNLQSIR